MFSFTKISKKTKVMIIFSETKDKKDGRFKRQKNLIWNPLFFLDIDSKKDKIINRKKVEASDKIE